MAAPASSTASTPRSWVGCHDDPRPTRLCGDVRTDRGRPGAARLGDTELLVEVERDHTVYREEVKFGGGKVIRDGMGQSQLGMAAAVDTVITNALILDWSGIVKADIGIKEGRIAGIGKAGNPDIQPGAGIVIGPGTEAIAGEGLIVTAGGIDSHKPGALLSVESRKSLFRAPIA